MSIELLGIVLDACLTGIIVIYIIWDHAKDDRFLAKKVKEFYENIENLIFFYCLTKMVDSFYTEHKEEFINPFTKLESISYLKRISSSLPAIRSPLPTIREFFSNEHSYYKEKVKKEFLAPTKLFDLLSKEEKFVDFPKYLNLNSLEGDNKGKMKYINKTFFVLYENGKLQRSDGKEIIEDYSEIKKESYDSIKWYLESLRDYWNKNHHKFFIKPKLKDICDFEKDLENPVDFFKEKFSPKFKEDYFTIGNLLTYHRNYGDAINFFDKALEIDIDYKEALNSKGVVLFYQRKNVKAIECLDKALEIDPNYKEAWNNKGWVLVAEKRYVDALEYLNKVLEINPNDILALSNKGWALVAQEKYNEALEYLDRALDKKSNYIFAMNNKGYALSGLKRYKEALEYCDKVLKIDSNDIFTLNSKGIALGGLKRYKEALECLDKALEIDPNYIFALNNKGYALSGLKRYNEALEYYHKAIEIDSNYAIAWYNKARLESLRNNLEESIKSLKKAIELDESIIEKAKLEADFDNIRDSDEFKELIG